MTRRFPFDKFTELLTPDETRIAPKADLITTFEDRVPKELIDFWQNYQLGSFGDGLLWFFDPRDLIEETRRFDSTDDQIPFARTAFGDFFSLAGEAVSLTNVQHNVTASSGPRLDIFGFSYFGSDTDVDEILMRPLKRDAESDLGKIDADQCYGYKLAISLGGEETVKNLRISSLTVYLDLLATLHQ